MRIVPPDAHSIDIIQNVAHCTCGWRSESHASKRAAETDGDEHVTGMTPRS